MKLRTQNPPHIRSRESNLTMMTDIVIATLPLYAMAVYYYGTRALLLGGFGVIVSSLADGACQLLAGKIPNIRDLSGAVTGLLIPLLLPASAGYSMILLAALFGIAVAKQPFGGMGQNIFNPAAAGTAFAMICWPKSAFAYPIPFERLPAMVDDTVRLVSSPAYSLSLGGTPNIDLLDMLLGNVPGPMGGTNILVLLTCLIFLIVRKTVGLAMPAAFLGGASLMALLTPRVDAPALTAVAYELMSGLLVIGAVFLINDPVTYPKRTLPKIFYGFGTGALSVAFRHIGRYEESFLFALLVMNATVWIIDVWGEHLAHAMRRKNREFKTNPPVSEPAEQDVGAAQK